MAIRITEQCLYPGVREGRALCIGKQMPVSSHGTRIHDERPCKVGPSSSFEFQSAGGEDGCRAERLRLTGPPLNVRGWINAMEKQRFEEG